jgi:ATP-dependent Lhr-like helicase
VVARDLTEPSPLALEVLSARPYAYLEDAPLEERRTQAVISRRWLSAEEASDLGRLDPGAIHRVRGEARPDAANADELHDALVWLGFLSAAEVQASWHGWLAALARAAGSTAAWAAGDALDRRRAPAAVRGALARGEARSGDRRTGDGCRMELVAG